MPVPSLALRRDTQECVCLAIRPWLEQKQVCALQPAEGTQLHSAACAVHSLEIKCSGTITQPCKFPAVQSHISDLS